MLVFGYPCVVVLAAGVQFRGQILDKTVLYRVYIVRQERRESQTLPMLDQKRR